MQNRKVLFCTHECLDRTPVSRAMFEGVALGLRSYGMNVSIVSALENKTVGRAAEELEGVNYEYFSRNSYGEISLLDIFRYFGAFFLMVKLILSNQILIVRSYPMMLFGCVAKLAFRKVIFDTRGLFFEELFDSGKLVRSRTLVRVFYYAERLFLFCADSVVCVTEPQRDFYLDRYPYSKDKFKVIPNCAVKSKVVEDKSGGDIISLVYLGSLVKWHSPSLVRSVCDELVKLGQPFTLDVITKDKDKADVYFSGLGKFVSIFEHPYRNKPIRYDYGFSLISGGVSKTVCFPVKFMEYIQSGTKVVSSSNVTVCREFICKYGFGINVDAEASPREIALSLVKHHNCLGAGKVVLPVEYEFESQVSAFVEAVETL